MCRSSTEPILIINRILLQLKTPTYLIWRLRPAEFQWSIVVNKTIQISNSRAINQSLKIREIDLETKKSESCFFLLTRFYHRSRFFHAFDSFRSALNQNYSTLRYCRVSRKKTFFVCFLPLKLKCDSCIIRDAFQK